MEKLTGSKLGKEYNKAVYHHPVYLIYMQSTSRKMPGWMSYKPEPRLLEETATTSNMQVDTTLMAESEEELKSLLVRVKEEGEKAGLKLNIQKAKIMASSPITSWGIDQGKVEAVTDFIFLDSKITADGDCSHEIKRCLLLGRKAMAKPDSILISRDITLPTKIHIVKAIVFPVVMYGCERWTIKKAEGKELMLSNCGCWRRLLRLPWTSRRSNQSVLKEINPEW